GGIAEQGGQETGGAEASVCGTDGANAFDVRLIIEQDTAASVDLAIDEPGQQDPAGQIAHFRVWRDAGREFHDAAVLDDHRVVAPALRREHACVGERGGHQTVSVTLARWGGWSGSRPRAIASAFTAR